MTRVVGFSLAMMMQPDSTGAASAATALLGLTKSLSPDEAAALRRAIDELVAQGVVREQVGRSDLDTVLGARGPLSALASKQLQDSLDIYRTGLVVTELNLQDARPPEEVKPAFDEVNSAQQIQESLVNEARAYAARIVPEARGEASRTRTVAEGYKTASIARATATRTCHGSSRPSVDSITMPNWSYSGASE